MEDLLLSDTTPALVRSATLPIPISETTPEPARAIHLCSCDFNNWSSCTT